ncbi:MAG TPA: DUF2268 domain-containing putative Zn-dependent protease [Symbiobacteriaceae bacterium]
MSVIPVYQDVLRALRSVGDGYPAWPAFAEGVYRLHRAYFDGLLETYGETMLGPGGLSGAVERMAPSLRQALASAPGFGLEAQVGHILQAIRLLLPGDEPDLYLGTLFFMAPAATLSVNGRPAIALGLERFHPAPPSSGQKFWYHPREVVEMVPHEAAHAARMQVLGLPPTPRLLTLLEMVMLEGTALTFTDLYLGRMTLATFMDSERLNWHQQHDAAVRAHAAADFAASGMPAFLKYFSAHSPVSGYYVGYSLCREYLDRFGADSVRELVALPSVQILRRLGLSSGDPQ